MAKQLDENTSMGIDIDGDGKSDFSLSIKTIGAMIFAIVSLAGVWFSLQADIQEAKELPKPEISKMEIDIKDELIRQTIMDTQEDVKEIKKVLELMDQRLYDLQNKKR